MKKLATLFLALIAFSTFSLKAQDAADKEVVMGITKEYAAALSLNEEQREQAMVILREFITKVKNVEVSEEAGENALEETIASHMKEANMRMKALLNDEQMELFSTKKAELKERAMKYLTKELENNSQSDEE